MSGKGTIDGARGEPLRAGNGKHIHDVDFRVSDQVNGAFDEMRSRLFYAIESLEAVNRLLLNAELRAERNATTDAALARAEQALRVLGGSK